jgi:hypothetical protein
VFIEGTDGLIGIADLDGLQELFTARRMLLYVLV